MKIKEKYPKDEGGFTLIEIIAVLIVLGILAVVALPKYFDLQDEAKQKALLGGVAEAKARVHQYAAQQLLAGDTVGQIVYSSANVGTDFGDDFVVTFADGTTNINVDITGAGNLSGVSTNFDVPRPGR